MLIYFIPSPFDAVLNGKHLFSDFDCFIYFADGKIVQSMLKIQQKFHVLFVGRIIAGEIPLRFLTNLLDGHILLVHQKRNVCLLLCTQSVRKNPASKMKFTNVHDWLLESTKTNKLISCHQLLCSHLFSINYLLFCEMYEIYKEQIYVPALNAQNRLFQSNTILDKTT